LRKLPASGIDFHQNAQRGMHMKAKTSVVLPMLRLLAAYIAFRVQVGMLLLIVLLFTYDTLPWWIVIPVVLVLDVLLFTFQGKHSILHDNHLSQNAAVKQELEQLHPESIGLCNYLSSFGCPVYKNTLCDYYPLGEIFFDALLQDIEAAKVFIFMEFFAIANGELWSQIEPALLQKAAEGIEIRIMYDDMGSLFKLPPQFRKRLTEAGIHLQPFNPLLFRLSKAIFDYRNHQKIVIIDGEKGYACGVNIGDEYANLYPKYGHWKDVGIRLQGDAVWPMTVLFLQMWNASDDDIGRYKPTICYKEAFGFYQLIVDGPLNNPHNPAEEVYCQILYNAKKEVSITSPYLMIDTAMFDALRIAVRRGVDVRLYMPYNHDHWYNKLGSQAHYARLLSNGVRIFEYTPGFIHAKMLVCDDDIAIIGSINMDYRSFFQQYECGVLMYGTPAVQEIKEDMKSIALQSQEIRWETWKQRPLPLRIAQTVMLPFAPLM